MASSGAAASGSSRIPLPLATFRLSAVSGFQPPVGRQGLGRGGLSRGALLELYETPRDNPLVTSLAFIKWEQAAPPTLPKVAQPSLQGLFLVLCSLADDLQILAAMCAVRPLMPSCLEHAITASFFASMSHNLASTGLFDKVQ